MQSLPLLDGHVGPQDSLFPGLPRTQTPCLRTRAMQAQAYDPHWANVSLEAHNLLNGSGRVELFPTMIMYM
jgi:hypothetical protein